MVYSRESVKHAIHNSIFYEGAAIHNTENQAGIRELHDKTYFTKIILAQMFRKQTGERKFAMVLRCLYGSLSEFVFSF